MTRSVAEPKLYPRGSMWVSVFKFDTSTLDTCLKQVYSNINMPQTAAMVARVGFLTRPLCHNNPRKFANVVAESGRPLAGGRTYRHLSCEIPATELPQLRDLTRSMLWSHVVNDRYTKSTYFAVLTIQKLFYVFQEKKERLAKARAKEELKARLKKEHEAAMAKERTARENEERSNRLRERSARHSGKIRNSEDSSGFFSVGSTKRKSQNDGNSVIGSLLGSLSGKHRGSMSRDEGDAPSVRESDPVSFVGNFIGSMSGKYRGRLNSNASEATDQAEQSLERRPQPDTSSMIGGFIGSLSGKYRSGVTESPEKSTHSSASEGSPTKAYTGSPNKPSRAPNLPAVPADDRETDL
jgi:uncharacterized protein YdaU (DUF1376 family)